MLSPARAYAAEAARGERGGLPVALRRPLFIALIQGVAVSMVATHTVAMPSVAVVGLCWAIAVAVQIAAALILIASVRHPHISTARALDLLFMGHAPWSLWLLAWAAVLTWGYTASGMPWIAVLTMVVPSALTGRIVSAFANQVLRLEPRAARRRMALHQGLIWISLVAFFAFAVQLWQRAIAYLS